VEPDRHGSLEKGTDVGVDVKKMEHEVR
jgi:hypothetical protein